MVVVVAAGAVGVAAAAARSEGLLQDGDSGVSCRFCTETNMMCVCFVLRHVCVLLCCVSRNFLLLFFFAWSGLCLFVLAACIT